MFQGGLVYYSPSLTGILTTAGLNLAIGYLFYRVLKYFYQKYPNSFKKFYPKKPFIINNAPPLLLGGVPILLAVITTYFLVTQMNHTWWVFTNLELDIFSTWLVITLMTCAFSIIDDLFELKPMFKLLSQGIPIILFSYKISQLAFVNNQVLWFCFLVFVQYAILNGNNLLDGLNTLNVKVTWVVYFSYFLFATVINLDAIVLLTLFFTSATLSFYFFNKTPAKFYLGELGATLLGQTHILLVTLCIFATKEAGIKLEECIIWSLMPLALLFIELGVSFVRRVISNRSPFRGDRLHLHYLINKNFSYDHDKASSFYSITYLNVYGVAFMIGHFVNPILGLAFLVCAIIFVSFHLGKSEWTISPEFKLLNYVLKSKKDKLPIQVDIEKKEGEEYYDKKKYL